MLLNKIESVFKLFHCKLSIEFIQEKIKKDFNEDYSLEDILGTLIKNGYKGMYCPTTAKCIVWKKPGYYINEYKEEHCPFNQYVSTGYWNPGLSLSKIDECIYSNHRGSRSTLNELIQLIEKVTS